MEVLDIKFRKFQLVVDSADAVHDHQWKKYKIETKFIPAKFHCSQ